MRFRWAFLSPFILAAVVSMSAAEADDTTAQTAVEFAQKDSLYPVDYYDGLRAYENGQKEIAISLWLKASTYGDGRAMLRVATAYRYGDVLPAVPTLEAFYALLAKRFGQSLSYDPLEGLDPETVRQIQAQVDAFEPVTPAGVERPAEATASPTSLMLAAAGTGDIAAMQKLIDADPQAINYGDQNGWTPIFETIFTGQTEAFEYLVSQRSTLSGMTMKGFSILHVAAMGASSEMIERLLALGAHPMAATPSGLTPEEVALRSNRPDVAKLLGNAAKVEIKTVQAKLNQLGYEVGKPDGVWGQTSRMQLDLFASGRGIGEGNALFASAAVVPHELDLLLSTDKIAWTGVVVYRSGSDPEAFQIMPSVSATGRAEAGKQVLAACKGILGAKGCKVELALPAGACASLGWTDAHQEWSRVFPTEAEAEADGLALCRKRSDGSECLAWNVCAEK